jgi:hypothetical protein
MTDQKSPIVIRYAETDDDIIMMHRFLCVVAGPLLPGRIDPKKSATEVWRVTKQEVALMAVQDNILIGTLGLVQPDFWWGKVHFLANRWFFTLPRSRAGRPLLKEARAIARASALELHIYDEQRGRLVIMNRSPLRDRARATGAPPTSEAVH